MRTLLAVSIAAGLALPVSGAVIPKQPKPSEVAVTVTYTGKAPVDATHEIWVFLFDTPSISQGTRPIVAQTIKKNGDSTIFKNVTQDPVYVAVAFDDKGTYDGTAAPPPPGTPIAYFTADGKSTAFPVKTAGGAKLKMMFNDARRMQ